MVIKVKKGYDGEGIFRRFLVLPVQRIKVPGKLPTCAVKAVEACPHDYN